MSMSRKHFTAIAEVLRSTNASDKTITEMAWMCAQFNPHFKRDTFLEACGYKEYMRQWKGVKA